MRGMRCLDTSRNTKIPLLMEMVGALRRATEPQEVIRIFGEGMREIEGPRGYISVSTRGLKPGEYRITRLLTDLEGLRGADIDSWSSPSQYEVQTGGFIGEIIRSAYPEVIHDLDVRDDAVLGDAIAHFRSMMAIPLFDNGEPLNWAIMLSEEPEGYDVRQLEETILRGNLVGGTVKTKLLTKELKKANEAAQREVQQIADIQTALLPDPLPNIAGLKIGASYETFGLAGGDYYDLVPIEHLEDGSPDPEGPWGIVIADAAGHGPAAATVVAMLNSILYAHSPGEEHGGPASVMEFANHHLYSKGLKSTFVTAMLARYCPKTRKFIYARAGHNPALLMQVRDGEVRLRRLDEVGGIPLGIDPDAKYEAAVIDLEPGDTIMLYTDGITEGMSPGGEQFGMEGIERSLTTCSGDPQCVIDHVVSSLRKHEAGLQPGDDQTLLVFKVVGEIDGAPCCE